jgi:hypothetical protein
MNNELEGVWKVRVVARLKMLSWYLPGRSEENHKKPFRIANLQAKI